jgi:hypothetical protein
MRAAADAEVLGVEIDLAQPQNTGGFSCTAATRLEGCSKVRAPT